MSEQPNLTPQQQKRRTIALIWACLFATGFFMWFVIDPPESVGYSITLIGTVAGVIGTILAYAYEKRQ